MNRKKRIIISLIVGFIAIILIGLGIYSSLIKKSASNNKSKTESTGNAVSSYTTNQVDYYKKIQMLNNTLLVKDFIQSFDLNSSEDKLKVLLNYIYNQTQSDEISISDIKKANKEYFGSDSVINFSNVNCLNETGKVCFKYQKNKNKYTLTDNMPDSNHLTYDVLSFEDTSLLTMSDNSITIYKYIYYVKKYVFSQENVINETDKAYATPADLLKGVNLVLTIPSDKSIDQMDDIDNLKLNFALYEYKFVKDGGESYVIKSINKVK